MNCVKVSKQIFIHRPEEKQTNVVLIKDDSVSGMYSTQSQEDCD